MAGVPLSSVADCRLVVLSGRRVVVDGKQKAQLVLLPFGLASERTKGLWHVVRWRLVSSSGSEAFPLLL